MSGKLLGHELQFSPSPQQVDFSEVDAELEFGAQMFIRD